MFGLYFDVQIVCNWNKNKSVTKTHKRFNLGVISLYEYFNFNTKKKMPKKKEIVALFNKKPSE